MSDSCHMATDSPLGDDEVFERARNGCSYIKKGFDVWINDIRPGVVRCRKIADERGGKKTFQNLLEQHGLADVVNKYAASRLLKISKPDNLEYVIKWHERLTAKEKAEWSSPSAILKQCPIFKKPPDPDKPKKVSAYQKLQERNLELQDQVKDLSHREDGDSYNAATDKPEDIARAWLGQFGNYKNGKSKLKLAATYVLEMLEKDKAKAAKPKAKADKTDDDHLRKLGRGLTAALNSIG
jgi:hypothetical protein